MVQIAEVNPSDFITPQQLIAALSENFGYVETKKLLDQTLELIGDNAYLKKGTVIDYQLERPTEFIDDLLNEDDTLLEALTPVTVSNVLMQYEVNTDEDDFMKDVTVLDFSAAYDGNAINGADLDGFPEKISIKAFTSDDQLLDKDEFETTPLEIELQNFKQPIDKIEFKPWDLDLNTRQDIKLGQFTFQYDDEIVPEVFASGLQKIIDAETQITEPFLTMINNGLERFGVELLPKSDDWVIDDKGIELQLVKKEFQDEIADRFPISESFLEFFEFNKGANDKFSLEPFGEIYVNTDSDYIDFERLYKNLHLDKLPFKEIVNVPDTFSFLNGLSEAKQFLPFLGKLRKNTTTSTSTQTTTL